ncbi:HlyD family efflux transporter periplasmic adaptor subunit [Dyella japonica]|uniref:Multidrug efflux system membrane fusion protein n=1 Tax=Dyella japonica TaxID=231455 RepID=A0ABV2JNZ9_9GAMM
MSSTRIIGQAVATVSVIAAIVLIVVAVIVVDRRPRTHDAYIYAYSASLTPEVSGRIVAINIRNDQAVRKGDVLLQLDPEPFQYRLQQANAQVQALQAQIALTGRQVTSQGSGAQAATHQVERARQQLSLAHDTRERLEPLYAKGFATTQQMDQARTDERSAQAQLDTAIQQASQAREAIGDVESLKAQLLGALAAQQLATRDLRETSIVAPIDGRIAGLNLALGSFATAGHPVLTLIDDNHWYAVANFRETDLAHLHAGDQATVWVMGHDDQPLHGVVESLGPGVQPVGSVGPGLPQVDRNLNWVVVAQRFPIWVHLRNGDAPMLRVGATASVRVTHDRAN